MEEEYNKEMGKFFVYSQVDKIFLKFLFVGVFVFALFFPAASFAATQNVWGSAWSSTIGWIRFGSSPTEIATSYHVTYDATTGALAGYAWSSNIGWVNAAPASPYPALPSKSATVNASGVVEGWMRITAIADAGTVVAGGWSGWIKMSGTNYGVVLNKNTGNFTGFAWSPEIGWINFKGVSTTIANQKPTTPTLVNPIGGLDLYAIGGQWLDFPVQPPLTWLAYNDPDGDPQQSYTIQLTSGTDINFSTPLIDKETASPGSIQCAFPCGGSLAALQWKTEYRWRMKVKDNRGAESDWSASETFLTPKHPRPIADFSFPTTVNAKVAIQFVDTSKCSEYPIPTPPFFFCSTKPLYSALQPGVKYVWTFGDGSISNERNPQHQYAHAGSWMVTLVVTDADGYESAPTSKPITIGQPLPDWERITPF